MQPFSRHSESGELIAAFPPQSIQDLATMVKSSFPNVAGFFSWEASDDVDGTMYKQMMLDIAQSSTPTPPTAQQATLEIISWLNSLSGVSPG